MLFQIPQTTESLVLTKLLEQGPVVLVIVLGILGFFKFVIPAFQRLQEQHTSLLHEQIEEHRARSDKKDIQFLDTIKEVAATHERVVQNILAKVK